MGLDANEKEFMIRIPPFSSQRLEAACRVLADTERGLSGTQIERLLQEMEIADLSPMRWPVRKTSISSETTSSCSSIAR